MSTIQDVMQSILSCRDKINLGVRWPLSEAIIDTNDKTISHAVELLKGLVSKQVNVKNILSKRQIKYHNSVFLRRILR